MVFYLVNMKLMKMKICINGPMIVNLEDFLIDKNGIVQHQIVNNFPLGRNVEEALRMVDVLQHFEENGEVCPVKLRNKGEEET